MNLAAYRQTNFERVSEMNEAFGNPKGDRLTIDKEKLKAQCKNILDEYNELMKAFDEDDTEAIRDALCDIMVFAYGAFHLMGLNADADMESVVESIYSRFVKSNEDFAATLNVHQAKGIADVKWEGEYPTLVLKSARDQPDAPKGKFLKSASYHKPVFVGAALFASEHPDINKTGPLIATAGDSGVIHTHWGLAPEQQIPGDDGSSHEANNIYPNGDPK